MEGNLKLNKGSKTSICWKNQYGYLGKRWFVIGDLSISSTLSRLHLLLHKVAKAYDASSKFNPKLPWTKFTLF
jgi:hypothetical protein